LVHPIGRLALLRLNPLVSLCDQLQSGIIFKLKNGALPKRIYFRLGMAKAWATEGYYIIVIAGRRCNLGRENQGISGDR
jgi:hypothetical protein